MCVRKTNLCATATAIAPPSCATATSDAATSTSAAAATTRREAAEAALEAAKEKEASARSALAVADAALEEAKAKEAVHQGIKTPQSDKATMLDFMAKGIHNFIDWHLQPSETSKIQFLRDFAKRCTDERDGSAGDGAAAADEAAAAASVASDVQSIDDIADAILDDSTRPDTINEDQWKLVVAKGREAAKARKTARAAVRAKGFGVGGFRRVVRK